MTVKPILLIGKDGQVGRALARVDRTLHGWGRAEADLSNPEALYDALAALAPAAIINAAAYTAVDKAESEEALATRINAEAVAEMARYAAEATIPLVHYSTDYVFDGNGDQPRHEDSPVHPLNAYGRSKLAGEQAIEASGCPHLIFRTSWVYDEEGKNFLNTMLRLGAEREELSVVADQWGAPSYATHLARATLTCLNHAMAMDRFPSGIYHLCNSGVTSWHGFAQAIFEAAHRHGVALKVKDVLPIPASDYPTPAARPANSRLDLSKLADVFGVTMASWQDGLTECVRHKYENQ